MPDPTISETSDRRSSPPPPPPPRSALRRDGRRGLIGGVAAGVAEHLGLDIVLVRIGFVILTIFSQGLGAVAYLVGWILIPPADESSSGFVGHHPSGPTGRAGSDDDARRGPAFWIGVALLTLGASWFLGAVMRPGMLLGWVDGGVVIPLLLIGLGVALWRRSERAGPASSVGSSDRWTAAPPPGTAPTTTSAYRAPEPTTIPPPPTNASPVPLAGDPGIDEEWTPPPKLESERSILTRVVLGSTFVTAGVLWILDLADVTAIGLLRILAIALAMIGLGLLVGSVVGRGRWLILPGMLLVPVVFVGSLLRGVPVVDVALALGSGADAEQRLEQPIGVDELLPVYEFGAGRFRLDLTELDADPGEELATSIEVDAGEVTVLVPGELDVVFDGSLGAGELIAFGQRRSGLGVQLAVTDLAPEASPGSEEPARLDIEVDAGLGDVTIERISR